MSNEGNIYILAGPGKIKITHNVLSVSPKLSYLSIYFVGVYIMSSSGQISMPIVNSASCPSGYFIALTSKSIYSYTLPIKYDIGTLNITSEKVTQTIKKQDGTTVDVDVTNTYSPYTSSFHENCMTGLYVNQNTFIKNIDPSDILCINYGSNYWVNPMLLNSTETNITNPSGLSSSNYNILKNWNDYIDARKNFAVSASLGYGLYKDVSVIKKTISNITANGVESAQTAKRLENSVNIWGHEFDGEYDIDGDLSSVGSISMNGTITGCTNINDINNDIAAIRTSITNIETTSGKSSDTAKQLETTHNIWGKPFNGTNDVSGSLSSVNDINMTGEIIGSTTISVIDSSISDLYSKVGSLSGGTNLKDGLTVWGKTFDGQTNITGDLSSVNDINMVGEIIGSTTISKINTSIIDLYSKVGSSSNSSSGGTTLKDGITLWGKPFNGSSSVNGSLIDVDSITMTGEIIGSTTISKINTSIIDLYSKVGSSSNSSSGGTKLKDGLTLWGQPFNGTSSVDGSLINVKDISMNGDITGCTTLNTNNINLTNILTAKKANDTTDNYTSIENGTLKSMHIFSSNDLNVGSSKDNSTYINSGTIYTDYINLMNQLLVGDINSDNHTLINKGDIFTNNLTVTGIAHFFELIIDKLRSVGGSVILTPATGFEVDIVEQVTDGYFLYFLAKNNEGKEIINEWMVGDQAICQSFNQAKEGVSYNVSSKKYWSLVTEVDSAAVSKNTSAGSKDFHYIKISSIESEYKYTLDPEVGDTIVMLGSRVENDPARSSAIYIAAYSSIDTGITAPLFATYQGINDFDLTKHRKTYIDSTGAQFVGKFTAVSGKDIEDMINAKDSSTILYAHYAYCTDITTDTVSNTKTYYGFEKAVTGKIYSGYKYMGLCSDHISDETALTADSYSWSQILYDTSTLKAPDQYTLIDQGTEAYAYINDSAELNTKIILYYSIEYNNGHTLTILSSLPSGYTLEWYYSENPSSTHTNIPYESSHTGWYYSIADSYNKSYNFITVRLIYTNTNNNVTTTTVIKSVIVPIILKSQAALTITDEIKMMATSNSSSYNALNSSILSNIQRIGSLEVSSTQIQSKLTDDETKINTIDGSIVEISNSYSTITQTINDINAKVQKQTTDLNSSFGYVNDKFASIDTSLNGISMTVSNVSNYVNGTITNKISEISTKVDSINLSVKDVQVGGVNILNGTDFTKINSTNKNLYWENFYYDSFLEGPITNTYSLTLSNASITSTYLDAISQSIEGKLLNSTWYTLSFYSYSGSKFSTFIYSSSAKTASENVGNTETGVSFIIDGQSSSSAVDCYHLWNDASNTGWTKHTYTFKTSAGFSSTDSLHFLIRLTKSDNSVITGISQIQLEEGTIATAWRPSAHDYESGIDITATSITSHVNDVSSRLNSSIIQTATSITSYVNDVSAGLNSSIMQTANSITSYVNDVSSRTNTEIQQLSNRISLSVKQVGGKNLLEGTNFSTTNSEFIKKWITCFSPNSFIDGPITNTVALGEVENDKYNSDYDTEHSGYKILDVLKQDITGKLLPSSWYTLSFYDIAGSTGSIFSSYITTENSSIYVGDSDTNFLYDDIETSPTGTCYHLWNDSSKNGWIKHTFVFKTSKLITKTTPIYFIIRMQQYYNSYIYGIGCIQLEEGNTATTWSPSAHDYESGIDITATSITSYVNDVSARLNSSIIQTANSITSYVNDVSAGLNSSIMQTANSITSYVNDVSAGLNSSIMQTANSITSYVNDVSSRTNTEIQQLSNRISLSVKQVGGKNLLKGTDFTKVISMTGTNFWNIFNYTDGFTEGPSKDSSALIANNNTSYEKEILKQSIDGILMPSSFYTLSFYSYGGSKFYTYIYDEYANTTNENVGDTYANTIIDGQDFKQSADCGHLWDDSSETGWKKHTYIFKTQSTIKDTNEKIYFLVRLDDSTEKITGISKIQLEEGTTDTTWSPSSHDYESELDITADSITGKVMDLSSGVYTKIQQTSKEISLTVEESKIGGRNLMSNSDFNNGMENWNINNTGTSNVNGYLTESDLPTGISHGIVINVEDKENGLYTNFLNNKLNKDAQYTVSFYGKVDSGSCDMYFGYEKVSTTNVSLSTTWQRFHMTFTYDGNNYSIVFYPTASCIFYITGVMIEEGNMMSSWCLSALEINNINVTNKLLSTGIDIKNKIITATTDNFKIKNNSGDTTFYVDVSGNLIGSGNASFKGDIYATNGTFSGIINAGQSIINGNINLYSTNNGGISVYDSNNIEKILITPSSMSTYSDIFTGTATSYTHSINLADNINTEIHTVNSTIQGGIQTLGTFNNGDVLQFSKLTLNVNIDGIIDSNFNLYPHLTLYRENDSNYSTEIFSDTSSVSGVTDVNYNDKDITISTDGTYYLKLSMTIICGDYNNEYGKHPYISYSCLLNIQKIVGILNNKTIIAQDGLMVGFTNTSWLFANTKEIEIRWNNHGLKLSDDGFQQLYNSTTWGPFMCYRNIKDITELSLTSNGGYSVSTTDETLVLYSTSSDNTHKIFITEDNQINGRVITIMDKTSSTTYVKFYTSYLKANQNTKTTGSTTWELTDSAVHKITFVTNIGWIEEYMG